jgi:protein TonB
VSVLKGITECPACDVAALKAVKKMPDWKPGRQNGRPVRTYFNLPVSFKIDEADKKK